MEIVNKSIDKFRKIFTGKTETVVFTCLLGYLVLHFIFRDILNHNTDWIGLGSHIALVVIGLFPLALLLFALLSGFVHGEKWGVYLTLFIVFLFTRFRFFTWIFANDFRILHVIDVILGLFAFLYVAAKLLTTFKEGRWHVEMPQHPLHLALLFASVIGMYVLFGVGVLPALALVAVLLFLRGAHVSSYALIAYIGILPLFLRFQDWTANGTFAIQFYTTLTWLRFLLPLVLFALAVTVYVWEKRHKEFVPAFQGFCQSLSGGKASSPKKAKTTEKAPAEKDGQKEEPEEDAEEVPKETSGKK